MNIAVRTFWFRMLVKQVFSTLMAATSIVRLSLAWFLITFVAMTLNGSNIWGYLRARFNSTSSSDSIFTRVSQKVTEMAGKLVMSGRHRGGGYSRPDFYSPPEADSNI